MVQQDFQRRMPEASRDLRKPVGFWQRIHIDIPLLFGLLALTAYGLIVLYSASGETKFYVQRQAVFIALGYVAMFTAAQFKMSFLQRWSPWFYLGGVGLLALVLVMGSGAKGAQRWLSLGGFRFQPSEIIKLAVPMMVAAYLGARVLPPSFKHIVVSLMIVGLPTVLILEQPDLGTSLLIAASGLIGLFFSGLRWRYILGATFLALMSAWPMWQFVLRDYQKQRILTMFNPEADKLGAGWNIIQSKTAIGSGGIYGKGWMNGTQSQLNFLPESHTDFIIAVLAEEFGLLGVLLLLLIYLFILGRGLLIAARAQSSFNRILAGCITFTFFVYIFVNIGMVTGLLPVVGVPLPLVSHGGTAIVTLLTGFGLLMAISTERRKVSI
ncbi:rod shape-determining protein RodA [Pseudoteredinibacter isoporae]|uniref:Peptidoglycan glycosyltransferase MrdB n=1 Tax=Pseudoteredinibacter isoporae TaxID=570281 RepID=A0A7X0MYD3_9GAMM|nr:rod shape-determining protein RodA [Pseudoteredinibacter isoporae]MBB6522949.1 rod shape determining protein RodA [Pseudoteredinibacter isoporae]NHO88473.1 rod shape-determining protein RodA [Pseudoteredinibacter isoporae]NIB22128.1 rod shape-determining protein RodA [Pseudoteredinibacter isoporae]